MNGISKVQPIFVLSCPRAGTTMLGMLLGSVQGVLNYDEVAAYYFSTYIAEREYAKIPSPFKGSYLFYLRKNAIEYLYKIASQRGYRAFCETTPWNLRVVNRLVADFPEAIFIVLIRGYRGTIQSMRRSYENGYSWAGPSDRERACVWSELYGYLASFSSARTVIFNYDFLRRSPNQALKEFRRDLEQVGLENAAMDWSVLTTSYSNLNDVRGTSAVMATDGTIVLKELPTYDDTTWSETDETVALEVCLSTIEMLRQRYGYVPE